LAVLPHSRPRSHVVEPLIWMMSWAVILNEAGDKLYYEVFAVVHGSISDM